jgi:hypothetical protein
VRRDHGDQGAGRDSPCARLPAAGHFRRVRTMGRFAAPLSFTIAAAWVVVLFVLVHGAA